jgi:hypothetical protein
MKKLGPCLSDTLETGDKVVKSNLSICIGEAEICIVYEGVD